MVVAGPHLPALDRSGRRRTSTGESQTLWADEHSVVHGIFFSVVGNFPRLYMGIAVLCRFAWPAQGIVHRVNSEQNVKVL